MLSGRRVLVAVCGSVAAYKMADVVRGLVKDGADVQVLLSPGARRFVTPELFSALSGHRAHTDLFAEPDRVVHVELGRWAEALLVGGASASALARMAAGDASEIVAATYLMCRCPVLVAAAMHTEMWESPAVRRSVSTLDADGVAFVGPVRGDLASGDSGLGRLADPAEIVAAVRAALGPRDLRGRRVLVTAGPTREPIDPVRFLSNRSTGKMGYELARAAVARGADVTLITGPSPLDPPAGCTVVGVTTAEEMLEACLKTFDTTDVVVKVAAVADYRPVRVAADKLEKDDLAGGIALERNPDIAAELGRRKTHQILVAFAAQTSDVVAKAHSKLVAKGADLVVANVVGRPGTGFDSDTNQAAFVEHEGVTELPVMPKSELAHRILDRVVEIAGLRGR